MIKNEVCQIFFLSRQQIRKEKTRQTASTAPQTAGRPIGPLLLSEQVAGGQQIYETQRHRWKMEIPSSLSRGCSHGMGKSGRKIMPTGTISRDGMRFSVEIFRKKGGRHALICLSGLRALRVLICPNGRKDDPLLRMGGNKLFQFLDHAVH